MDKYTTPTDPDYERAKGRVALWLDPEDLIWLVSRCSYASDASEDEKDRWWRIRFRIGAALHKASFATEPEVAPEEIEAALIQDAQLARERGLKFQVAQKTERHARCEYLKETEDLQEALAEAKSIESYERGVYVIFPDGLGFIYWTSRDPNSLNSSVITLEYSA